MSAKTVCKREKQLRQNNSITFVLKVNIYLSHFLILYFECKTVW